MIYKDTITILNKRSRKYTQSGLDEWVKTVVPNCLWYDEEASTVDTTGAKISAKHKILVPYTGNYKPAEEWVLNPSGAYTISTDDYVILGEVQEDPTPNNIQTIVKTYGYNACFVKFYTELKDRGMNHVQLRIEGV